MANDAEVLPAAVSTTAGPAKTKGKKKTTTKAAATAAKKPKTTKQQVPATHPKVSEMVIAAIRTLKERHGSSLYAIRKYISTNYQCDVDKLSNFIKRALKKGVENGTFVHTKGIGATGSFKLKKPDSKTPANKGSKVEKKPRKKAAAATTGTQTKKQPAAGKKASSVKKGPAAASAAGATKQKSTKPSKTAAKKPKAPKPKKSTDAQKVSPKK